MKRNAVIETEPGDDTLEALGELVEERRHQQLVMERKAIWDKVAELTGQVVSSSFAVLDLRHVLEDKAIRTLLVEGVGERRARRQVEDQLDAREARLQALDVAVSEARQARDQALARGQQERVTRLLGRQQALDAKLGTPTLTMAGLAGLLDEARAIGRDAQLTARWTPDRQPRWGAWGAWGTTLITNPLLPLAELAKRAVHLYERGGTR